MTLELFSAHDFVTLVECFAKYDYSTPPGTRVIIDVGANIGISAAYFLAASESAYVVAYEPSPVNRARLSRNLAGFSGRWTLHPEAWATTEGAAEFSVEPTGRYGSLLPRNGEIIIVSTLDARREFGRVAAEFGSVELLKIDVEGIEADLLRAVVGAFGADFPARVIAELGREDVELAGYNHKRRGNVVTYDLRSRT